ncbi:MAG: pyridoxamine 5'-phosphate oxidase family protein [Bacteroidota bacterium]|nr:pyridoxamine 5'-phosphate oxidase family protein [Bacteroidota bacterium]
MLGTLSEQQIEGLLKKQVTGRLGCSVDGITYIVPINYVYRDNTIFGHSAEGKKIEMMRKNPNVCFQVDHIQTVFKWQSVVAWGRFEEITDLDEKQQAMQGLIHRIMPLINSASGHPSHGITGKESDIGTTIELIVYKIVLSKITGRFETD